ncbi:MAG: hypothetical protein KDD82_20515, partial [Planctomycetes bacterium]|nr:hypothetical protein [Planctomycetota bacterium]
MKFSAAPPQLPSRSTLVGGVLLLVGVIYAADVLLLQPEHPEKLVASALAILAAPVAWYTLRRGINVFAASTAFLALVYAGYAVFDALSPHNPLAEFLPRSLRGGTLSTRLLGAAVLFALSLRSAWASSRRRAQGDDEDEGEDDAPAGDGA